MHILIVVGMLVVASVLILGGVLIKEASQLEKEIAAELREADNNQHQGQDKKRPFGDDPSTEEQDDYEI